MSLNDTESFNTTDVTTAEDTSQSRDEASGIHIQTTEASTQPTALNITSSENSTCEGIIT